METNTYRRVETSDLISSALSIITGKGYDPLVDTKKYKRSGGREVVKITLDKPIPNMEDKIFPQVILHNSYDKTCALKVYIGAFRFICSNGLAISFPNTVKFQYVLRHRAGQKIETFLNNFQDIVSMAVDNIYHHVAETVNTLQMTEMTAEKKKDMADKLLEGGHITKRQNKKVAQVIDFPKRNEDSANNLWAFYNQVNEIVSWKTLKGAERQTHLMETMYRLAA